MDRPDIPTPESAEFYPENRKKLISKHVCSCFKGLISFFRGVAASTHSRVRDVDAVVEED